MSLFNRNILDFTNNASVSGNPDKSSHVLAYIGDTQTPVYVPITALQDVVLQQPIDENVSAQGVDGTTTAYLNQGFNVITVADSNNFAIRLPNPPVKGKNVIIVNTSGYPVTVYPSIVGGSINGVVNGTAIVPSDSKAYTFTCWENPGPGAWSWTPPAINQIVVPAMTLAHTNGIATTKFGTGGTLDNSVAVGTSGANITLTGASWVAVPTGSTFTKFKCYTNAIAADAVDTKWNAIVRFGYRFGNMGIDAGVCGMGDAYGNLLTVGTGAVSSPPIVGGAGTEYAFADASTDPILSQIPFLTTQVYYTFEMNIPSNYASKSYIFRFFIEYT